MQNSNGTTRHRQVVENCFLFFYNNIDSLEVLSRNVSKTIRPGRKRKTNFSIITSFAWFVIDYSSSPISLPRSRFLGERCVTFKKRLRGRLFTNQSVEKMLCYCKNTNWKLLIQWSKQSFLGLRQRVHFDLKHLLYQKHFNLQETAFLLVVDEKIEREPGISLFPFSCLGQCIVFTQCM